MNFEQRMENPRERIYLPELLKEVSNTKLRLDKIKMLRAFANKNKEQFDLMKDFIQCTWHPAVVFELPETKPPYKTEYADYNLAPTTLNKALKRAGYFVKGHPTFIVNVPKREQIYIQTLEGMYKDDAELYLMTKEKAIDQTKYKGITEELVREAFAGFLPPKNEKAAEN